MEITPPPTHGRVRAPQRPAAFTLVEVLVTLTILGVLAVLAAAVVPSVAARADRADALGKIRAMGTAVLQYAPDHGGLMPPLFPGQVLEYEQGRGGRIVTECATYLGLPAEPPRYLAVQLMPRAYARLDQPADKNALRVYVMNTAVTNRGTVVNPFGRVTTPGQPPTANTPLTVLAGAKATWMMSTADQQQSNVAAAPWKANTSRNPPLGDVRAVFRFDGSAGLELVGGL